VLLIEGWVGDEVSLKSFEFMSGKNFWCYGQHLGRFKGGDVKVYTI
jgi:hypothetical protein